MPQVQSVLITLYSSFGQDYNHHKVQLWTLDIYIFPGPYSHISWQVTDPYCLLAKNISSLSCGSLQLTTCSLISHRASEPESKRWKPKRKKKKKPHYFCNLINKVTSHYCYPLLVRSQTLWKAGVQQKASIPRGRYHQRPPWSYLPYCLNKNKGE